MVLAHLVHTGVRSEGRENAAHPPGGWRRKGSGQEITIVNTFATVPAVKLGRNEKWTTEDTELHRETADRSSAMHRVLFG